MKADFALGMMLIKLRPCGKKKTKRPAAERLCRREALARVRVGRTGRERGCAGGRFALFSDKT